MPALNAFPDARRAAALGAILLCLAPAAPAPGRTQEALPETFFSAAIHGSRRVDADALRRRLGPKMWELLAHRRSRSGDEKAASLHRWLEEEVRRMGGFGWARLELVPLPPSEGKRPVLFLFDVVEKEDMAVRFPFRAAPRGDVPDPGGLLKAWGEYDRLGWELVRKGEIEAGRERCPAFYCAFSEAEALKPYETRFLREVPEHRKALERVFAEDRDPTRRAQALLLLSYAASGEQFSRLAAEGLLDPDGQVRDVAVRALIGVAVYAPEAPLPLREGLRMLDFPYPDDRERGLALLMSVADRPAYRPFFLREAAEPVIEALRSPHPTIRGRAHTVLSLVSGRSLPPEDEKAWRRWLEEARGAATPASRPR